MVVVFILVPKNSGLREYREIALSYLADIDPSKVMEARGEDIPFLVEQYIKKGKEAIGLTGEDLYREYCIEQRETKLRVVKRMTWDEPRAMFRKPALCLIGQKDRDLATLPRILTVFISSKYRRIAKRYLNFLERKGFTFRKSYVTGCIEASCSEGIADLIIDVVYTGNSIQKYGLKVYDKIMESDFLIISGKGEEND